MKSRLFLALIALAALGAAQPGPKPITLSPADAEKEGKALVAEMLSQKPAENTTNTAILKIRRPDRSRIEVPVRTEIIASPNQWRTMYETTTSSNNVRLTITHSDGKPNDYVLSEYAPGKQPVTHSLSGNETMVPFAGSDFWVADLGLEFLHWPTQLLTQKTIRKSRACDVLESINPKARPGDYARVVSWVDRESDGILHADAYDLKGNRIKQFDPKNLEKVNGQYQLQSMEMLNLQNNSATVIEFDLDEN